MNHSIPIADALDQVTLALTCALKHRDIYTQMHSDRVIALSMALGRSCALNSRELTILKISANLHDLGKIGIADDILMKPGPFDARETEIMHTHPEKGADIVASLELEYAGEASNAIRHHHENYDGSGYPDGLVGEDIPIYSRIITVADCYDAMMETRPYHRSRTHSQTMDMLISEHEKKFDPQVFEAFTKVIEPGCLEAL